MTIKEIELATELPRASVRYYESEGLICPSRGENGYRNYSQSDLDTLLKIRLLRQLQVSIEDIRALHLGRRTLNQVLDECLSCLDQETKELEYARTLCRTLQADRADYSRLDARPYLRQLEQREPGTPAAPSPVTEYDRWSTPRCPFRRYFARNLDLTLYCGAFLLFCQLVLRLNVASGHPALTILASTVSLALMLVVEPFLLHFFCTTPGKFLFGLRITRSDGSPLSWKEAFHRTLSVLFLGMALNIPLASSIAGIYAFYRLNKGEPMRWDYDLDVVYGDGTRPGEHYWDFPGHVGKALLAAALILCVPLTLSRTDLFARVPRHQGNLTVAEFVENYNDYIRYQQQDGDSPRYLLTEGGTFSKQPAEMGAFIYDLVQADPIPFTFHTKENLLTGITFSYESRDEQGIPLPSQSMATALWAFLYGREGMDNDALTLAHDEIQAFGRTFGREQDGAASFHYELPGATADFCITQEGYIVTSWGSLLAPEGTPVSCRMEFSLLLTE